MDSPNQKEVIAPNAPTDEAKAEETTKSHPQPPQASPSISSIPSPTRIPKKIQPAIDSSASQELTSALQQSNQVNQHRSNSFSDGPLILPDGVTLPASVTPQMLDGRLRRNFLELSPQQMREVLQEFDEAVKEKGAEIRNTTAYLFGVVKRYKSIHERAATGYNVVPQGSELSSKVVARLDTLVASGFCTSDELDMKIKDRMKMLPEKDALDAIDEMNGCSRDEIRNFGSYFMGIMNRYMRGERQNPLTRGANRARNNQGGRQYDDNRNNYRDRNGGGNDKRFSHYGRNDSRDGSSSHYGRNGDRRDGRDRRSSRDNDRDRDRDNYRSSRRRRSRSRSRSGSYDSRSRSRSDSRDRYRRRRSRSDSRDRHRSRRRDDSRSSRDSRRGTSHRDSSSTKTYGQPQPAVAQMLQPQPPQPPRPQNMMQPMAMGQQMMPGQPQQMMPMQQQQFMQQLGQIPPQMGQGQNPQQIQQMLLQQQLQMQQQKASLQQPQMQFNPNMVQQKMMPGSYQPNNPAWSMQNQNAAQQTPIDILGLADKAAQALSGRMPANPNFPPPPAAAPPDQSYQQQNNMAAEKDLPMMVQYAIQNLRTTGHIETTLDAPLCAMIKKLPEHAALQALEIFSSCDLSKMRNKQAYLSGILKKELVKNGL